MNESSSNIDVLMEDATMYNPFECLSKDLKTYVEGPYNLKKPLLQFSTKVNNISKTILWIEGDVSVIYVRPIIVRATQESIIFYG